MLDNLIGLSTIDVTLTPDAINLPVVEEGWRPAVVARDAMRTLVSAMQGLGNVAIWLAIFVLPLAADRSSTPVTSHTPTPRSTGASM
jgi:hypothetical protein